MRMRLLLREYIKIEGNNFLELDTELVILDQSI